LPDLSTCLGSALFSTRCARIEALSKGLLGHAVRRPNAARTESRLPFYEPSAPGWWGICSTAWGSHRDAGHSHVAQALSQFWTGASRAPLQGWFSSPASRPHEQPSIVVMVRAGGAYWLSGGWWWCFRRWRRRHSAYGSMAGRLAGVPSEKSDRPPLSMADVLAVSGPCEVPWGGPGRRAAGSPPSWATVSSPPYSGVA